MSITRQRGFEILLKRYVFWHNLLEETQKEILAGLEVISDLAEIKEEVVVLDMGNRPIKPDYLYEM